MVEIENGMRRDAHWADAQLRTDGPLTSRLSSRGGEERRLLRILAKGI